MTVRYVSDLDVACRECNATFTASEVHVCPGARAELLKHLADDNADLAKEYCDKHGGYVDEGRTQPMATGSPYRICDGCVDEGQRLVQARETYHDDCGYLNSFHIDGRCPIELGPNGARARSGDA